ncbi:MFS transporter [Streptomyces himastatinicus]|nr:MFS transporter [Streptomyces himastatinicus]
MNSLQLFRVNPDFRRYWTARSISLIGDGVAMVALLLLAGNSDAGAAGVAAVLLAQSVPRFFGPVAGALPDRFEVRRILLVAELGQGAVFVAIAAVPSTTAALVPLVALSSCLATVFVAAGRTVMPRLVEEPQLMSANAWMGTAFNLQAAVGPVIGGALTAAFEPRGALLVNALTFFVGAFFLLRLPRLEPVRDATGKRGNFLADIGAGLVFTWRHRAARVIVLLLLFGVLFGSLDNVALVLLASDVLDAGPLGFGLLGTASGVAMVAASLWLTRSATTFSPATIMAGGWIITGAGLAATGLSPVLAVAVAAQGVAGMGNSLAMVGEETLLQKSVPAAMLGRVGGAVSSAAFAGSALAYAAGGYLASVLSPRTVLIIAGTGLMAVTAACVPALRVAGRQDREATTDDDEPGTKPPAKDDAAQDAAAQSDAAQAGAAQDDAAPTSRA